MNGDWRCGFSPPHLRCVRYPGGWLGRATLTDVVKHYNVPMSLGLTDQEISDIVEYLKSL